MIIGITGTIGAGKGTAVLHFAKKGFRHASISELLAGEAARKGLAPTRVTRRVLANEYREKGPTALVEAAWNASIPADEGHVAIEALHTVQEVNFVKNLGGTVISIDAPLPVRFERVKKRKSEKDAVSYEEFLLEQDLQMASDNPDENNLQAAMEAADFHITNDASLQEFYTKLDEVVQKLRP